MLANVEVVEHLDHLDFPWGEGEAGQALKSVDLGEGQEGVAEAVGPAPVGEPGEAIPKEGQRTRQGWNVEFGFEEGTALVGLCDIELALEYFLA